MAAALKYTDYLLYAAAKDVNHSQYKAVINGIIGYLKETLGIYLEETTLDITYFLPKQTTTINLEVGPISAINSIIYDGSSVSFTFYGRDILLDSAVSDIRKPLTINATVGYTEIPDALVLAIYRHIDSEIFHIRHNSDEIEKSINSTGNTTYFRIDSLPLTVKQAYSYYSNRIGILG